MASSPSWKVYDADGTYQAACKEREAAAALVAWYGRGATVRHRHNLVVWTEGVDGSAAESYDQTAAVMWEIFSGRRPKEAAALQALAAITTQPKDA